MGAEELQALLRRQPFFPIRIHLPDGQTYQVRYSEMALLTRFTVEVGIEHV
jgi:hypothetical protein